MSDLLFWVLCSILFVVAVVCIVFGSLVGGQQSRYLFWVATGVWVVFIVALAMVLKARYL